MFYKNSYRGRGFVRKLSEKVHYMIKIPTVLPGCKLPSYPELTS